ncbi:hypothetical protein [Blastococcus mobilis]|uniref:Uncharacterized protein n=1 Tax=Blastococcus mobilis TaxID=1938746 RepID=A0A238VFJ0_9ACTN|nr:hypothetical protein [Blastococcus mobilis]SNR33026.1 hypothetical protein SAMN06272737_10381 [Blastococcus mobilis]
MVPTRWRKKPVEIVALQYDGTNANQIVNWIEGSRPDGFVPAYTDDQGELHIATLEGDMHVSIGDHVIRGVQGEFYPCKPDIFAATYDRVG